MRSRLQKLFGPAMPWVFQPHRAALTCVGAFVLSLPLTWQHPWLALLGLVAVWCLSLALSVEAPLLQSLPLPPLTVFLIGLSLRWGLGPLLLAVGGSGGDAFVDIWIRHGPPAQLLWLTFTAALLILAIPQRAVIARAAKAQPQSTWLAEAVMQPRLRDQLTGLAWILSVYMLAYITLSMFSGAFDRQVDTFVSWTQQLWRLDTPVAAFSRLRDLWFFLFPLWLGLLSRPWRLFLCIEMGAFMAAALFSGSRGLLFYPILLVSFGLWLVLNDTRCLRQLALVLSVLVLLLSPLIYVVRESPDFQRAESWTGRLNAVGVALVKPEPLLSRSRWIGRDLYACHDPYLFKDENLNQRSAGTSGLESLLYLWVPKHVMPDQPVIFDGHLIAKQLQGVRLDMLWYPCFSLPADLMRRWALPGVLVGSLAVASLVQLLFRLWYKTVSISGSTFHLLLLFFPSTYLQSFPFGTVSETAWSFLWELPKYVAVLWLIGGLVDLYLRRPEP